MTIKPDQLETWTKSYNSFIKQISNQNNKSNFDTNSTNEPSKTKNWLSQNIHKKDSFVTCALLNCRSIRNKVDLLHDFVTDNSINVALGNSSFNFLNFPRPSNGDGIGLLYQKCFKVISSKHFELVSCELAVCLVQLNNNKIVQIILIYRPPSFNISTFHENSRHILFLCSMIIL